MAKNVKKKSAAKKVTAEKKEEVKKIEELQVQDPVVVSSGGSATIPETVPPADMSMGEPSAADLPPEVEEPTVSRGKRPNIQSMEEMPAPVTAKASAGPNAEEVLKAYMISRKGIDSIKQVSKGGNFASNRTGEIFIPISVVNQIIAAK
jgi:hypothetical protein